MRGLKRFKRTKRISEGVYRFIDEFDVILCRNLVFTYFQEDLQREIFHRLMTKLKSGGYFIIGNHESIMEDQDVLDAYGKLIFRKRT